MSFASTTQPQVAPLTSRDIELASLGNYYAGSTPTPGTGVISGNPTTLVATTPYLVIYNGNAGGGPDVHLHFIRLMSTVVGGGAAAKNFTHFVDQGNRYTSGGTGLTLKNTNPLSTNTTKAVATAGVLTASAANNQNQISNEVFRVGADVAFDQYEFQFGGIGSMGTPVATIQAFSRSMPPIVLPPNSSYILNIWSGTFTQGITFEIQLGFSEK